MKYINPVSHEGIPYYKPEYHDIKININYLISINQIFSRYYINNIYNLFLYLLTSLFTIIYKKMICCCHILFLHLSHQ